MNPVLAEAAGNVQLGWLLGLMTIVFLIAFLGWTWWAFAPSRRARMEEYARMPLDEGDS